MKTSRSDLAAKTIGIILGVALGVGGAALIGQTASDRAANRIADDRCWVQGGTYRDGTCEMPEDKLTPEAKVCMAMKGSYMVTGAEFKCYSSQGEELKMPDLEGKEVIVIDDTVVLRDK